jgi:hypothetical protein
LRQLADQQLGRPRRLARRTVTQAEKYSGDATVWAREQRLLLGGPFETDGLGPCTLLRR